MHKEAVMANMLSAKAAKPMANADHQPDWLRVETS